jgi:hypothetical protein
MEDSKNLRPQDSGKQQEQEEGTSVDPGKDERREQEVGFLYVAPPDEEKERERFRKALKDGDESECIKDVEPPLIIGETGIFYGITFRKK